VIAVDTNVVVRLLMGDDAEQAGVATRLFEREAVFIAKSVILETELVLRRGYRQTSSAIARALENLVALPNVTCEDIGGVRQALVWHRSGMDFADALHLAASARATRFATFDRDMVKVAKRLDLAVSEP
jgi:predicted nucleic-acid-binding protein